jgi:hypothetical protein
VRHVHRRASRAELLGEIVNLRHVFAAVDAEATELCFVSAGLFNFKKWCSGGVSACRACSRRALDGLTHVSR